MIFNENISEKIWDLKYRYRLGNLIKDKTIEDTWKRVAKAAANVEKKPDRTHWQNEFYKILENFQFLPGGRILAGAGTKHKVTLFNCFVMPIVEDSMNGIFDALKEGALTLQQGGGVGYDFSTLRPKGCPVKQTGTIAAGPVAFMRIWNSMCQALLTTGSRRGAMMGILRCDHPDIEEFISAKSNPHELRHFNVSVLVSDKFMDAVKNNADWELKFPCNDSSVIYKTIKAKTLWEKIIKSAYEYAEPGVIFEDTINRLNNLWYREWITATNPCGEIPLPIYGACNLGSINLTQCVLNPFQTSADLDWEKIKNITRIATRFLDNVVDVSKYPLKAQKFEAINTRRIGLGITGLADAFVMLNIHYGNPKSLTLTDKIMRLVSETTWETSIALAEEKGSFPLYEPDKYLAGEFVQNIASHLQDKIKKHGMRNSHHNTIAPAGTISILANNISSGIEPIFSPSYQRHVKTATDEILNFNVMDYALGLWQSFSRTEKLPPAWCDAQKLSIDAHLGIQGVLQKYVDNAISKTINIPENFPFEQLTAVYTRAHELNLKGCTIFRPNPTTGSILEVSPQDEDVDKCCVFS